MARISQETIAQVMAISILELAEVLGDGPRRFGKQYQVNCPNSSHSEKTPDTYIEPNKNIFTCFGGGGCGARGNSCISYYAWHEFGAYEAKEHFIKSIRGIADLMGIPVKSESGQIISKGNITYTPKEIKRLVELEPQSAEIVDRVYRVFLSLCPIRPQHAREWLEERKYTKEQVAIMQLRSVPSKEEWLKIYELMDVKGYPFERIPGFSQQFIPEIMDHPFPTQLIEEDKKRQGVWAYAPSVTNGYFIPVRDEFGRIIRLRVRNTSTHVKEGAKPRSKYIWFSSENNLDVEKHPFKWRKNGVSSGAPINVVVPAPIMQKWKPGRHISKVFRTDTVMACEGEHTSYISANRLGIPIWGAPGAGNFKDMIPMIQSWDVKKFIISFDMDTLQKVDDSVKSAKKQQSLFEILVAFAKEAVQLEVEVYLWTWNLKDAKGLDDLLLQNLLPYEVNLKTGEKKLVSLSDLQYQ